MSLYLKRWKPLTVSELQFLGSTCREAALLLWSSSWIWAGHNETIPERRLLLLTGHHHSCPPPRGSPPGPEATGSQLNVHEWQKQTRYEFSINPNECRWRCNMQQKQCCAIEPKGDNLHYLWAKGQIWCIYFYLLNIPEALKIGNIRARIRGCTFFLYFHFEIQSISEVLCYAPVPRVHGLHKHPFANAP